MRKWFWLGLGVLGVTVWVTYAPALKLNFYGDDYSFVETAGRSSLSQYLALYFDPRLQTGWYRPMQGMLFGLEYLLFGGAPAGYHWVNVLVHLLNCIVFLVTVRRVVANVGVALTAAFIYAGLPLYGVAVFWPGDADFLLTLFYLLSIFFWIVYLQMDQRTCYLAGFAFFILALSTKEFGVTVPVVLFLADRSLIAKPISFSATVRRYMPFVVVWMIYLPLELYIQSRSVLTNLYGYGLGSHTFPNLVQYLAWIAFPWGLPEPVNYLWLVVTVILMGWQAWHKRDARIPFLAAAAVVSFLPVINFPWFFTRYLYMSVMASALIAAFFLDWIWARIVSRQVRLIAASAAVVFIVLLNGLGSAEAAADFAETGRQTRVAFRDISQRHPTFPEGTLLYFVDPPQPTSQYSGMFFLRYGPGVHVTSNESTTQRANLSAYGNAYVIYFDEQRRTREMAVEASAVASAIEIDFVAPIRFQGYELPSTDVQSDQPIMLFLYWRATGQMNRDYGVFVHLLDSNGAVAARYDGKPRKSPSSSWRPGELVAEVMQLSVSQLQPGTYRLAVGLYDTQSLERLRTTSLSGLVSGDQITLPSLTLIKK